MDKASRLEIDILKEGEDCPDCNSNSGWVSCPVAGDVQNMNKCEWCHKNPNSKFKQARWKK